ncbi:hypothetical protein D1007_25476 [Hordeum vulgare]|nr:hypothetical protein D1007_25476 [Hordeum vulgare]
MGSFLRDAPSSCACAWCLAMLRRRPELAEDECLGSSFLSFPCSLSLLLTASSLLFYSRPPWMAARSFSASHLARTPARGGNHRPLVAGDCRHGSLELTVAHHRREWDSRPRIRPQLPSLTS